VISLLAILKISYQKPVVTELNVDDTVEVIAGPFKSMKAKITRVDYEKQEATVVIRFAISNSCYR
jgi:transcription antitermination factor NusG